MGNKDAVLPKCYKVMRPSHDEIRRRETGVLTALVSGPKTNPEITAIVKGIMVPDMTLLLGKAKRLGLIAKNGLIRNGNRGLRRAPVQSYRITKRGKVFLAGDIDWNAYAKENNIEIWKRKNK